MEVWRVTRAPYDALDGEGARRLGGRWNSEGTAVVYASDSLALAAMEYLVHLSRDQAPDDLVAVTIEVPDEARIETVNREALPDDWNQITEHPVLQEIGDRWVEEGASLVLRVPSVIVPEEHNLLLNPVHPGAEHLRVIGTRPFAYDPRLLR